MSESQALIITMKSVPLKKVSICPKPTLLHTSDDNYYIIFITDFFSDKKCLGYDIEREYFFDLCQYPDLRLISPIYSSSPNGESLYIFDGEHQSFAMLDISIDINDGCHHPKVINIKKTKRKTEKLRNLVQTGKGCLSIFLPKPWNEYHIIGGQTNNQHLKWSSSKKSFIRVSETNSILGNKENDNQEITNNKFNNNGICATSIYFSSKFKQFILMGGGINNDIDCIWNLSYPSTESRGFWWLKSLSKLPYKNMSQFGSIMFNQQYIITFGGIAIKTNSSKPQKPKPINDIFILDIERNEWRKSKSICPCNGTFHAIFLPKFKKIHLFNRQHIKQKNGNEFQHWLIDLDYVLKQTVAFKRQIFDIDAHENLNAYNENDEIEIKNAEEIDPQQHILYKKNIIKQKDIQQNQDIDIKKDIYQIRNEISTIWDFITKLKQDIHTINKFQVEIIKTCTQNSQRITQLSVKQKDKEKEKEKEIKRKKKKREKQLKRAQNTNLYHNVDKRKQDGFSLNYNYSPQRPAHHDIFDTDDSDNDDDDDDFVDNNNDNDNDNDNGHIKNLNMMSGNVEYDSIEIEDEQDEKLKAKINKEIKRTGSDEINKSDQEKVKLKEWLISHRLGEYYTIFLEKGYKCLDQLYRLDDNTLLTEIGVTKLVHRRKLIAKLKQYNASK